MTEGALRAWARDHAMLVDSAVAAVVVLAFAVRAAWWLRKNSLQDAKAALLARATSSGRMARGWPAIELYLALGGLFGGVFLLFAYKVRSQSYA